jgi:hypothetical protein
VQPGPQRPGGTFIFTTENITMTSMTMTFLPIRPEDLPTWPGLIRIDLFHPEFPDDIRASCYCVRKNLKRDLSGIMSRLEHQPTHRLQCWFEDNDLNFEHCGIELLWSPPADQTELRCYTTETLQLQQAIALRLHDHDTSYLVNAWAKGIGASPFSMSDHHRQAISRGLNGSYRMNDYAMLILDNGNVVFDTQKNIAAQLRVTPSTLTRWLNNGVVSPLWSEVLFIQGRDPAKHAFHAEFVKAGIEPDFFMDMSIAEIREKCMEVQAAKAKRGVR